MSAQHSPPSDQSSYIARLLKTEPHHRPDPDYLHLCRTRPTLLASRRHSIDSILKAHAHHRFKPLTASLAVNYFDRFLSRRTMPEKVWPFQLAAVACLSLAAKMEEVRVPLIVDLQVAIDGPAFEYVFEPKHVQRMEVLVMTTLDWRMRSVTPFHYLHSDFAVSSPVNVEIESLVSNRILNAARVVDFLGFPPSVIAAAAAGVDDVIGDRENREMVRSCRQLMDEYLLDTCHSEGLDAPPLSPVGVLDAPPSAASSETNVEEPQNKRPRLSVRGVRGPDQ